MSTPTQFAGKNDHGEFLVTVFPADGHLAASAEVAWRPSEWDTFDRPVKLAQVSS